MPWLSQGGWSVGETPPLRVLILLRALESYLLGTNPEPHHWPTQAELAIFFNVSDRRVRELARHLNERGLISFGKRTRCGGIRPAVTLVLTDEGMRIARAEQARIIWKPVSIGPHLRDVSWLVDELQGHVTLTELLRFIRGGAVDVEALRYAKPEAAAILEETLGEDIGG